MKYKNVKALGLAAALMSSAGVSFAAGTDAGITITNNVSLTYSVGGVGQTPVADSVDFMVDSLVSTSVVAQDAATITVIPGQTQQVTEFLITNTGNDTLDFELSALESTTGTALPGSVTDNADLGLAFTFYLDEGNGTYDGTEAVITRLDNLAADGTATVFVLTDIPASAVNGNIAGVSLSAEPAAEDGSNITNQAGDAWLQNTEQYVMADTTAEGITTGASGYSVVSSEVTIVKTVAVLSAPFGSSHAIPGATLRYTITITNAPTAGAAADLTTLTDPIDVTNFDTTGTQASVAFSSNNAGLTLPTSANVTFVSPNLSIDFSGASDLPAGDNYTVTFDVVLN